MFQQGEQGSYMPHRVGCVDGWQKKGWEGMGRGEEEGGEEIKEDGGCTGAIMRPDGF